MEAPVGLAAGVAGAMLIVFNSVAPGANQMAARGAHCAGAPANVTQRARDILGAYEAPLAAPRPSGRQQDRRDDCGKCRRRAAQRRLLLAGAGARHLAAGARERPTIFHPAVSIVLPSAQRCPLAPQANTKHSRAAGSLDLITIII